jgi:hypothetical protein
MIRTYGGALHGRRRGINEVTPCGCSELRSGQTAADWKHRDFASLVASCVAGKATARYETPSLRRACDELRAGENHRRETPSFPTVTMSFQSAKSSRLETPRLRFARRELRSGQNHCPLRNTITSLHS